MAKTTKAINDYTARMNAFSMVGIDENPNFGRVSNQSFGVIVKDADGNDRYVELRAVVRGNLEDENGDTLTALETLNFDMTEYQNKMEEKRVEAERKAREKEEKKKRDAEARAKKNKKNEE